MGHTFTSNLDFDTFRSGPVLILKTSTPVPKQKTGIIVAPKNKHLADLCQFPVSPFCLNPFLFLYLCPFLSTNLLSQLPVCPLLGQPRLSWNLPCLKEDSKLSTFLAALVVHLNFFFAECGSSKK